MPACAGCEGTHGVLTGYSRACAGGEGSAADGAGERPRREQVPAAGRCTQRSATCMHTTHAKHACSLHGVRRPAWTLPCNDATSREHPPPAPSAPTDGCARESREGRVGVGRRCPTVRSAQCSMQAAPPTVPMRALERERGRMAAALAAAACLFRVTQRFRSAARQVNEEDAREVMTLPRMAPRHR